MDNLVRQTENEFNTSVKKLEDLLTSLIGANTVVENIYYDNKRYTVELNVNGERLRIWEEDSVNILKLDFDPTMVAILISRAIAQHLSKTTERIRKYDLLTEKLSSMVK